MSQTDRNREGPRFRHALPPALQAPGPPFSQGWSDQKGTDQQELDESSGGYPDVSAFSTQVAP